MYESDNHEGNTHKIESENVSTCSENGRVIAVFYNDYDLIDMLKLKFRSSFFKVSN